MAVTVGFHFSHEQHSPADLLRHATLAAEAGFRAGMCSDHFHPWSDRQGHSGFAWSWLGAAMASTPMSFGTVNAPGQRYHPAVVAQAAATLSVMFPDRFWLAVGSGEALNESITGDEWPSKDERNERLESSVRTMRALWAGDAVDGARIYDRPQRPPLIVGAALSPETAGWVATWADALVTIAADRPAMREIVEAFRRGGGERKPMFLQVALSWAPTQKDAEDAAFDQWRQSALSRNQLSDLPTPAAFDRATADVRREDVLPKLRISPDIERHLEWIREDEAMGFERIYLHNVARAHQERFIDACASHILPAFSHVD